MADAKIPKGKMWLKTFYENPKGLFMGLYQKGGRIIANWLGWEYDYKPSLTHQAVYLKEEGRTFLAGRTNGRLPVHAPYRHRDARTGKAHRLAQAKEVGRTAG